MIEKTDIAPYTMALLWGCTQCGFVKEGGQPSMECPFCGAYQAAFIDVPQHVEFEARAKLKKGVSHNNADTREKRLALMATHGVLENFRFKGRQAP